jgi:hypothetical protein
MSEGLCQLMSMDMKPDLRYCPIFSSFIFLQLGPIQALVGQVLGQSVMPI